VRLNPRVATMIVILVAFLVCSRSAWPRTKYGVLHNFGAAGDGTTPYGPPVLDSRGNLFGVTTDGGTGSKQCSLGCGTVFELIRHPNGTWQEELLHDFTAGGESAFPHGSLIFDSSGSLYGTTSGYLSFAVGGIFKLSVSQGSWEFAMLYSDHAGPGLVFDKLGNLYGEIGPGDYYGAGAIGELSSGSNGWDYTELYSFCSQRGCYDGMGPPAPPVWDGKGNMFGTTTDGGIGQPTCWTYAGCGVIFEASPNGDGTWTYHVLHRFLEHSSSDGQSPAVGLVMDAAGNFYGSTSLGGVHNQGRVFKLSMSGGRWKEIPLYDFPDCAVGCYPGGGTMARDKAGNLYGAANGGGGNCGYTCGVIFKLTPQKGGRWKYSVVHKFSGPDGGFPWGVILDDKGNIFGTTTNGGTYNAGVAFEITQ
jgi:hypothetical protein